MEIFIIIISLVFISALFTMKKEKRYFINSFMEIKKDIDDGVWDSFILERAREDALAIAGFVLIFRNKAVTNAERRMRKDNVRNHRLEGVEAIIQKHNKIIKTSLIKRLNILGAKVDEHGCYVV